MQLSLTLPSVIVSQVSCVCLTTLILLLGVLGLDHIHVGRCLRLHFRPVCCRQSEHLLERLHSFWHNRHKLLNLNLETDSLDSLFHYLESEEGDLFVYWLHHGFGHVLNHVLVSPFVFVGNHVRIHHVAYCSSQTVVNVVNVCTKLFKFGSESLLIVSYVEECLCSGIDEAVLLPNRKHISFQAQVLEVVEGDAFHFYAFLTLDI